MSALRRMRETERPIAFKPWIYEIAKNACIDQFRAHAAPRRSPCRPTRDSLRADYGKLVGSEPTPDAAVVSADFDHLCGAFGGLSDTHHEILPASFEACPIARSASTWGSAAAVESTLFMPAGGGLSEEYDDPCPVPAAGASRR